MPDYEFEDWSLLVDVACQCLFSQFLINVNTVFFCN